MAIAAAHLERAIGSSLRRGLRSNQRALRKWLSLLLRGSLLSGSGAKGVAAHDLVRDVMIDRAEASAGGMAALQRETVRLLLDAYDEAGSGAALKEFIVGSIGWHVSGSQQAGVPLEKDPLLMRALSHDVSTICARAVSGIGLERLLAAMTACEASGSWMEAAQMSFAAATVALPGRGGQFYISVYKFYFFCNN